MLNLIQKKINIKKRVYPITNFNFSSNKFSRGYDLLYKDTSGNPNIIKDIVGKKEENKLCDMNFLEKYSNL